MSDSSETPESGPAASGASASASPAAHKSFKRRHWGALLGTTIVAVPVMIFVIWTAAALGWSYSSGDRPGYMQKIAHKGWLCKTWEGTLYTSIGNGFRSDSFQFSVRSDSLAHVMENLSGKKVSVHYEQHKGVPTSCFGETEYFVSAVREVNE